MVSSPRRSPANPTPLKFCFHCGRDTIGAPLFCNFCGRSYDVKLCPKLHANPRGTRVCSKCGSAELSTPQPRIPAWAIFLQFVFTVIGRLILLLGLIGWIVLLIEKFLFPRHPLLCFIAIVVDVAVHWWVWAEIPFYSRQQIHRWVQRSSNTGSENLPR